MFITAYSLELENLKQSKVHQQGVDKQTVVYPLNGTLLGNKREETTDNVAKWVNLKNTVLSKRYHTQKSTHCMVLFI